jgi:hypothetical protein
MVIKPKLSVSMMCGSSKTDNIGNLIWEKSFGGSDSESAESLISTSDGGFMICGLTGSSDGDFDRNMGSKDFS